MQGIKNALSKLFSTIKIHKKKFIAATVTTSVGAYFLRKYYSVLKGLKDSYQTVSKLSQALNSAGDAKITAYQSIVLNFHNSIPWQINYLQKTLDQQFHLTVLKNKISDARFSIHQKIQIFNELKVQILLDLFSMIFLGRMISLTSLVGQIIIGEELYELSATNDKDDDQELDSNDRDECKFQEQLDKSFGISESLSKKSMKQESKKLGIMNMGRKQKMSDEEETQDTKNKDSKKQIKDAIQRQFMKLLFAQFQNFVSLFFENLQDSAVAQELKDVDIKQKFDKAKLNQFFENLKFKCYELMFKRRRIFAHGNSSNNNIISTPNSDFDLLRQKKKNSSCSSTQQSDDVDIDDSTSITNFHICQLFNRASVSQQEISQSAQDIIHNIIEEKHNRQSTDRLFLAIKNKIQYSINLVIDCVGTGYFRSLLFDMVELDFNSYVKQLHDQIQRQEKPLQNLIKILPLMNRLRDFLLIPQHNFLSRTRIDQVYWSNLEEQEQINDDDLNQNQKQQFGQDLDNGSLQQEQKRINSNLVIFIQSLLLQDKELMKQMDASLRKKKSMMNLDSQDCGGLLSQLENSLNGAGGGQNQLQALLKMMA